MVVKSIPGAEPLVHMPVDEARKALALFGDPAR